MTARFARSRCSRPSWSCWAPAAAAMEGETAAATSRRTSSRGNRGTAASGSPSARRTSPSSSSSARSTPRRSRRPVTGWRSGSTWAPSGRAAGARAGRDRRLPRVHLHGADLVLPDSARRGAGRCRKGVRGVARGFRAARPDGLPADAVLERQRRGAADRAGRRAWRHQGLGPPSARRGPDAVRLARVPQAGGLPGRPAQGLRARVRALHAGRHQAPLRGPRQARGRRLDPVHHGRAALRLGQLRDPRGRQERPPARERPLRRARRQPRTRGRTCARWSSPFRGTRSR